MTYNKNIHTSQHAPEKGQELVLGKSGQTPIHMQQELNGKLEVVVKLQGGLGDLIVEAADRV